MSTFEELDRATIAETIHTVQAAVPVTFTWDYERSRDGLSRLYEKAKTSQWNASTDLDWTIDVDPGARHVPARWQPEGAVRRPRRPPRFTGPALR